MVNGTLSLTVSDVFTTPSSEQLPLDIGGQIGSDWVWLLYLVGVPLAMLLNGVQVFCLIRFPVLRKRPFAGYLLLQGGRDFVFNLITSVSLVLDFSVRRIYGGELGCSVMTVWASILFSHLLLWMAVLAHAMHRHVLFGKVSTPRTIAKQFGLSALYSLVFVLVCVVAFPSANGRIGRISSSGVFCFADYTTLPTVLGFFLFIVGASLAVIIVSYIKIFREMRRCNRVLVELKLHSLEWRAKAAQWREVKRLSLFILAMIGCVAPFGVAAIQEMIRGQHVHPTLDGIAGFFAHVLTMVNPIVYFALDDTHLLRNLWAKWRGVDPVTDHDKRASRDLLNMDRESLVEVLSQPTSLDFELLKKVIDERYASENLAFWTNVHGFVQNANIALKEAQKGTTVGEPISTALRVALVNLRATTSVIVKAHLNPPSSPLEINVSSLQLKQIRESLGYIYTDLKTSSPPAVMLPNLPSTLLTSTAPLKAEDVESIEKATHLFDDLQSEILHLIFANYYKYFLIKQSKRDTLLISRGTAAIGRRMSDYPSMNISARRSSAEMGSLGPISAETPSPKRDVTVTIVL